MARYLLLEDGSGALLLEDGQGLLLEDQDRLAVIDEGVSIPEELVKLLSYVRSADENVGIPEGLVRLSTNVKTITEGIDMQESTDAGLGLARISDDTVTIPENIVDIKDTPSIRIVNEGVGITETPSKYLFTLRFFITFKSRIVRNMSFVTRRKSDS